MLGLKRRHAIEDILHGLNEITIRRAVIVRSLINLRLEVRLPRRRNVVHDDVEE